MSTLERITKELNRHIDFINTIEMADIDELFMLIEAIEFQLPKRFVEISGKLDDFNIDSPQFHRDRCKRLVRILEVYSQLPKPLTDTLHEDLHPTFSLNADDKEQVLKLCSDMREIVLSTTNFDHPHKVRLSNRIAAIEAEVHKEKGMFDVVLGGVNDFGETLGSFGENIKPLTDRIGEVLKITRRATKQYDQLPSPDEVKQLPAPDASDTE